MKISLNTCLHVAVIDCSDSEDTADTLARLLMRGRREPLSLSKFVD